MVISKAEIRKQLTINHEQVKTFVFDLDGTIIYQGVPLEERFARVLLDIHEAGHQIVFATGRSTRDFLPMLPKWCLNQPSVLFGGGLVIANGEVLRQQLLPQDELTNLVNFLENEQASYLVDGHSRYYHPAKEHWLYDNIVKISGQVRDPNVDALLAAGAYKVLVLEDSYLDHFYKYVADRHLIVKYHFYDKCFDIMPAHVDKYSGLSTLDLPIKENVFVFGNDHNDLELFQALPNSIMFGHHHELLKYAKIQIEYDDDLFSNFSRVIDIILNK